MTLSDNISSDPVFTTTGILDSSITNLDSLYCSHLWTNSNLRNAIITAPFNENKMIKYCYTCKGKVRKYEIKAPTDNFKPNDHSTPNGNEIILGTIESVNGNSVEHCKTTEPNARNAQRDLDNTNVEIRQGIPSISQSVDSNNRQKFTSYDSRSNKANRRRLRKSLRGVGCIINFASTDSPVKKRTQIQACSISVMIIAIVVISFILVNFATPNFTRATNSMSTTVVPTKYLDVNDSLPTSEYKDLPLVTELTITEHITTAYVNEYNSDNSLRISNIISKIRKNIKTYPKESSKNDDHEKPKDIINRDLSQRFCSCQKNEICMLDENSGTSECRPSVDGDDPTGCGGLCALETEACHVVDKALGVRVCRSLTLVTCSPQEWRCRNGLCIPAGSRCDGSIQCYDRSDELNCVCDLTKQFRCGHFISCFPKDKRCDGIVDCWDGYDEANCTNECPKDKVPCTDGHCILSSRFCDGLVDCSDGSDEPDGCDGACGVREIRCKNNRCVPRAVLCNGHDDCGDTSDELNCSVQ